MGRECELFAIPKRLVYCKSVHFTVPLLLNSETPGDKMLFNIGEMSQVQRTSNG